MALKSLFPNVPNIYIETHTNTAQRGTAQNSKVHHSIRSMTHKNAKVFYFNDNFWSAQTKNHLSNQQIN